jgi:hypothetical protein
LREPLSHLMKRVYEAIAQLLIETAEGAKKDGDLSPELDAPELERLFAGSHPVADVSGEDRHRFPRSTQHHGRPGIYFVVRKATNIVRVLPLPLQLSLKRGIVS